MIDLTMEHFTTVSAFLDLTATAVHAASARAGVEYSKCLYERNFLYGGAETVFKSNPDKYNKFVPGWAGVQVGAIMNTANFACSPCKSIDEMDMRSSSANALQR